MIGVNKAISSIKYKSFVKIVAYPQNQYDPLHIATKGINDALAFKKEKFNVLQILRADTPARSVYTKVKESNTIYGTEDLLFDSYVIEKNRIYFDGVDNYLLMGGPTTEALNWIMGSLIYIKGHRKNKKVKKIFKEFIKEYPEHVDKKMPKIHSLKIENSSEVNIHFIIAAMYPSVKEYALYDLNARNVREFVDWNDVRQYAFRRSFKDFKEESFNVIFRQMPDYNRRLLSDIGLNVLDYFNGKSGKYSKEYYLKNKFKINLYYWSSVEEFSRFVIIN